MRKRVQKAGALWVALLSALAMVAFTAAGAMAAHPEVVLVGEDGNDLPAGSTAMFSFKETCSGCHTDHGSGSYGPAANYDDVEEHSYHAQLAANQFAGWNNWNPDSASSFSSGPAPKGKNWTQSPGHVGKW